MAGAVENILAGMAITGTPAQWDDEELAQLRSAYTDLGTRNGDAMTKWNPTPGTGRTGFQAVPPNNFPFYSEAEKYVPIMQADGGQLSEWKPMYQPTPEQAEKDRQAAYEAGVPHGYVAPGDKYRDGPMITLRVISELVSPSMRVEELRRVIRDKGGIIPALQRLSYAGRNLEDAQRTLEHYGIVYWNRKFPHWPIKIRRF